jgi:hypothetical protein
MKLYQYAFKVENHLLNEVGDIYRIGNVMTKRKLGRTCLKEMDGKLY